MIKESYFHSNKECHFMIHSELKSFRPTILFIHGLGDSSATYRNYLNSNLTENYNILIPDLLGYGKSGTSSDYRFEHQIQGIEQHIAYLEKHLAIHISDLILVAHSMGAIHATLLCESKLKNIIKAFINVEGSITQYGSFIAENMMSAVQENNFLNWFDDFKQRIIYEKLAQQCISIRPYYASLEFCDPTAFLKNGMQMIQMSRELKGQYTHLIGKKYRELTIPKIYCYGDTICQETLAFLQENKLISRYFPCKNHFLLAECNREFILFISKYIRNNESK